MAQTAPQVTGRTPPTPDIDELLGALNAERPTSLPNRPAAQRSIIQQAPVSLAGEHSVPSLPDVPTALPGRPDQAGDPAARRTQALVRAFDVLHKQVASIASQGETINSIATAQARQEQALAELQRTTRYLRAVVIQQLQGGAAKEASSPALQVKLVVAHLAESYRQAQHDAGVLAQWAMLFAGVALGATLGAALSAWAQLSAVLLVLGTAAVVALLVASIFAALARQARQRANQARRAMDEGILERPGASLQVMSDE